MTELDDQIEATRKRLKELLRQRRAAKMGRPPVSCDLPALKSAYLSGEQSGDELAASFDISRGTLMRIVRVNDWPRRLPVQSTSQQKRRAREATA
jgi:hypothetical protein